MKKLLAGLLVIALFVGMLPEAFLYAGDTNRANSNSVGKVRYYYKDSINNASVMTEDYEEFEQSLTNTEEIDVVLEMSYSFDGCICRELINKSSTKEEIDDIRNIHREEIKEFYFTQNSNFVEENNILCDDMEYNLVVCQYAPYIVIEFSEVAEFNSCSAQIIDLAEHGDIEGIDICVPITLESSTVPTVSINNAPEYPLSEAILDVAAASQTYDGEGVSVGIIEAKGVAYNRNHSDFDNLTIRTIGHAMDDPHAIMVTRILCGSAGVAPGVNEAFIYKATTDTQLVGGLDWMVDNGVNIVNLSLASDIYRGEYLWLSAVLDCYVRDNYITIVGAAGNHGETARPLTNYIAMGYNVIAVGALDANNNLSSYSSWADAGSALSRKPTLSAPGTKIRLDNTTIDSGTSFSTPIVSGIVAKLMDEYPFLMMYPEVVMASLIVSATPVNYQGNVWDSQTGAGRINYTKARNAVGNCCTFSNRSDITGVVDTDTISVTPNNRIKVAAVWLTNSQTMNTGDAVIERNHTNYNLELWNNSGVLVSSTDFSNIEYINFNNTNNNTLIIKLRQLEAIVSGEEDIGAFTWIAE